MIGCHCPDVVRCVALALEAMPKCTRLVKLNTTSTSPKRKSYLRMAREDREDPKKIKIFRSEVACTCQPRLLCPKFSPHLHKTYNLVVLYKMATRKVPSQFLTPEHRNEISRMTTCPSLCGSALVIKWTGTLMKQLKVTI